LIAKRPWPRITVVTPSYNQAEFIDETIRSVLSQEYPNLEYMVIDGGSSDGTPTIIRQHASRLSYWVSEKDRGQSHAINKGLARATGTIFGYLNSDDLLAPESLFRVAEAFESNPGASAVYGHCEYIDRGGKPLFSRRARFSGLNDYLRVWWLLQDGAFMTQPEVYCRTDELRAAGGFREDLRSVMDYETWVRLMSRGCQFHPIDAQIARFRVYPEQKSADDTAEGELLGVVRTVLQGADTISPTLRRELAYELAAARATGTLRSPRPLNAPQIVCRIAGNVIRILRSNPRIFLHARARRLAWTPARWWRSPLRMSIGRKIRSVTRADTSR
jgi:glycosyltransferase involved in cell wall biosynthesis